jgi:hypothetical protein
MPSFAELFRKSNFVKFDPKSPQIIQSTTVDPNLLNSITKKSDSIDLDGRPRFFGLKKDIPRRFWGRTPEFVQLKKQEGPFGFPIIEDCQLRVLRYEAQRLLFQIFGIRNDKTQDQNQQLINSLFDQNRTLKHVVDIYGGKHEPLVTPSTKIHVSGKVLERSKDGYKVDVVGLNGFIANEDVRGNFHNLAVGSFQKFWIKKLVVNRIEPNASIILALSMR